ncbi:MAG: hypothetical protein KGD61_10510, partial [Candidatus Lokiarchaeota archaeon]|nr:hypothetical protein [Candidatus Lokiarchaeota archaeon]
MKKLNIRNKEIPLLVLFGVLAFLFISVNSNQFLSPVDNNSNQGPNNFEIDFPRTSAPTINIISPITDQYFGATAPNFIVEISDAGDSIDTTWYTLNTNQTKHIFTS